jgi:DNA mismatch repair protein MutS2
MENLNKDLQNLDWFEILKQIQSSATSSLAREKVLQIKACESPSQAEKTLKEIQDAILILSYGERPFMESLDLYFPWFSRLKKNAVLKVLEFKDLRHFLVEVLALREVLKRTNTAWGHQYLPNLFDPEECLSAIDTILTPSGEIRMDASETLYRLFKEKENLARNIQHTLDRLVNDHDMTSFLQDKYVTTREGRWVLPIRGGMKSFMAGVIHGSSQTKQTVFMEPEAIVPLNNRLRMVEVEIEEEIERLLIELSTYLYGHVFPIEQAKEILEVADLRFAQAQFSQKISATHFEFCENDFSLLEVKHPLMQLAQLHQSTLNPSSKGAGKVVIANNVHLESPKTILLLSGPNAGGKTVLLKSIGLAAQMARCGLPICASQGSKLPFFKNIVIGIGDSQSVDEELSTFAAHLKILNNASELQGFNNLVLIDEICGSTDPEEGSALARSFIEKFSAHHIFSVITSHLSPLKAGWDENSSVVNGSMEYDSQTGKPTYQFILGISGDSMAIQTAKRVGIAPSIIERSLELLSPATRARLAGLDEIEKLKEELHHLRDNLKKESQKAQSTKNKYDEMIAKFNQEKDDLLNKEIKKTQKQVEELISQAKVENTFKRHSELQEIKFKLPEIVKGNQLPNMNAPVDQGAILTAEDFGKRYPPGSKVFVRSIGQDGIVQSAPNGKGELMILANSLRLNISWKDLKGPDQPQNPTKNILRRTSGFAASQSSAVDSDRTLDLRGKTVDEALGEVESELDRGSEQKIGRLKIIHGHGTEALKKAVRIFLSRSPYVKKWKAGTKENGGDGVTWAEF